MEDLGACFGGEMGDPNDFYNKLPMYFSEIEDKNPCSRTSIEIDGDGHFKYVFMPLGAYIARRKNFKPIIVIDATFLTRRFGGRVLTACTQDANNTYIYTGIQIGRF